MTRESDNAERALSIIHDEHRRFAIVLRRLDDAVGLASTPDGDTNLDIFHAAIHYIENFVDVFHHMKEDMYLFPLLRKRYPQAAAVLDLLHEEHQEGRRQLAEMADALQQYETYGYRVFLDFREAVRGYVEFERAHMATEETHVLPLARTHLSKADWAELVKVFTAHEDPLFGDQPQQKLRCLYADIAAMAPPTRSGKPNPTPRQIKH